LKQITLPPRGVNLELKENIMKTKWNSSNAEKIGKYIGLIEFQDNEEEYHNFEVYATKDRLVFGSACNVGFLESGYMPLDNNFSIDENLEELIEELKCFYDDGAEYTSKIICNDKM
jgi:hypothetical protein